MEFGELPLEIKVVICKLLAGSRGDCREVHTLSKGWRQAALLATTSLRLDPARLRLAPHRDTLLRFTNLTQVQLNLWDCSPPTLALAWLSLAPNLTTLDVLGAADGNMHFLDTLTGLSELNLTFRGEDGEERYQGLMGSFPGGLTQLPAFSSNNGLRVLKLARMGVRDQSFVSQLRQLEVLDLSGCPVSNLGPLTALVSLSPLELHECRVESLLPLGRLPSLRELAASYVTPSYWPHVTELTGLTYLCLDSASQIHGYLSFASLTGLQELHLRDVHHTPVYTTLTALTCLDVGDTDVCSVSWQGLTGLRSLVTLTVKGCHVEDLTPLTNMTGLTALDVSRTHVSDLTPLTNMTGLKVLDISLTPVHDIQPLTLVPSLTSLRMVGTGVRDGAPLIAMRNLKVVTLQGG